MPESEGLNSKQGWFVKSVSGGTFGPVDISELQQWARQSRIFPEDLVSVDNEKWRPARTLPQLRMDTVIATPDGRIHGPLHADAAAALVGNGKLPEGSKVFSAAELLTPLADKETPVPAKDSERFKEALEELRRETQDAIAEKDREIETLRAGIAAAEAAKEDAAAAEAEAAKDDAAAKTEAAAAKAEAEAAKAEAESAKAAADAAKAEAEEAKAAAETAKAEAEAAKADAASAKAEAEKAKAAEEAATAETRAAKDEAETAKAETAAAKAEAASAKEEAEKAKAAEEAAVAETEAAKADAETAKAEAEAAKAEVEAAKAAAAPPPDTAKLLEENENLSKTVEDQKSEIAELLDFSNARDREAKATIAELERRIAEISAPEIPAAESGDGPVGDARLVQTLQERVSDLTRERCALSEKLANAEASLAMATRPLEADTALLKKFAEEALDTLREEFEEEKRRNDAERTASVQRQNALHERIGDLERALRRDPGEKTRGELAEERSEKTISQLRQEIDSLREQHKADLGRAAENERALEGRLQAMQHRETAVREQLRRVEKRTADYDSLTSRLRRREEEIVEAEKQFGEARAQWQVVEQMLRRRIEELEHGAGSLFENEPDGDESARGNKLVLPGWVRNMK